MGITTYSEPGITFPVTAVRGLSTTMDDLMHGIDLTLTILKAEANFVGAKPLVIGGAAVAFHGCRSDTADRDVLLDKGDADRILSRLRLSQEWTVVDARGFICKDSQVFLDIKVTGDPLGVDSPVMFPSPHSLNSANELFENLRVIELDDLIVLKLLAGRMRDLADVMELCKRRMKDVDVDRIFSRLRPLKYKLCDAFLDILDNAPIELENERRIG